MKQLLEEGLRAGAIGLSIGLLYAPGSYTTREELAELCSILTKYNGLLSTHIRGEGNNLLPSVAEVIWIAERAGISLHISHLKAAGRANWGKALEALELVEDARARGMDVTVDVYPYAAGSTTLTTLLPPWVLVGGRQNYRLRQQRSRLYRPAFCHERRIRSAHPSVRRQRPACPLRHRYERSSVPHAGGNRAYRRNSRIEGQNPRVPGGFCII